MTSIFKRSEAKSRTLNRGWKALIDFTARDNRKIRDVRIEEVLDDSIVRELDESGLVKSLG